MLQYSLFQRMRAGLFGAGTRRLAIGTVLWQAFVCRMYIALAASRVVACRLLARRCAMWLVAGMDTSVWSVATAFEPAPRLDIFGDKSTTEARRRCRPGDDASDEEKLLFDLHYKVSTKYIRRRIGIGLIERYDRPRD